jgi:hypothetical protein
MSWIIRQSYQLSAIGYQKLGRRRCAAHGKVQGGDFVSPVLPRRRALTTLDACAKWGVTGSAKVAINEERAGVSRPFPASDS